MRQGTKVKVSYSGDMPETVTFDMREAALDGQLSPTRTLRQPGSMPTFPPECDETGSIVWSGIPAEEIVDGFLDDYIAGQGPTDPACVHR